MAESSVKSAWGQPYQGNADDLLIGILRSTWEDLQANDTTSIPYATQFQEIQSSGCGKSRRVHHLSFKVFTIPFNVNFKDSREGKAQ